MEERRRVERLLELEQSNVISFNDLEYDVAAKVGLQLDICVVSMYVLLLSWKLLDITILTSYTNE